MAVVAEPLLRRLDQSRVPSQPAPQTPAPAPPSRLRSLLIRVLVVRAIVTLLAAAFHAWSWLTPNTAYAAWLGHTFLIALAFLAPPRAAFRWGLAAGFLVTGVGFYWGIAALQLTMDAPLPLALALYSVLILVEGLCFALFCGAVSLFARRGGLAYLLIPCTWATLEFWFPRIFDWKVGYTQIEWTAMLQIASLFGSDAIAFVMTAAAAIPSLILFGQTNFVGSPAARAQNRRCIQGYCAFASLLLIATLTFGYTQTAHWHTLLPTFPQLKTALIQIDPSHVGSEQKLRAQSLALHDQVDLLCWPETSIGVYSAELTHFRDLENTQRLSRDSQTNLEPAKDFHCHLLAGGKVYAADAAHVGPFTMSAFLIDDTQAVLGKYHKRTLMPLGEYVPGQKYYPPLRHWMTIEHIIEPGSDPHPLVTSSGTRLGVLMCYEDTIPPNARHTAAAGAEILISLIQGSAFENPLTLIQHQRLSVLRAVENRRCFLRCASTGITCVISPLGEVLTTLPPQTEGPIQTSAPLIQTVSLYTRIGDILPFACTFLLLASFATPAYCSLKWITS